MQVKKNYDLTKLNTLGVHAIAHFFVEIHNEEDLQQLFNLKEFTQNPKLFLGGGSNILFTKDFDGIVVLNKLKGIEVQKTPDCFYVRAMSGEIWHDLVLFTVGNDLWGIENLSLIPGTVGGAPVQNIGAYGVELKDVLETVEAYNVSDGSKRIFTKKECEFGYRDSVFKNKFKKQNEQYFIFAITLKLSISEHGENKNVRYKVLQDYIQRNNIEIKSPKDVSNAVSAIRKSKLPDPNLIPNAGSFFKNVFVEEKKLQDLLAPYPAMPYFKEGKHEDKQIKIPAGWLIEQCGPANGTSWRGYRIGNVGVHEKHALVLVNYGGGSGQDLAKLSRDIIVSVQEKFGLQLIPEVNFI